VTPLTVELPCLASPKKHLAEARGLKSVESKVETSIRFVNRSKQAVKVYWLDFEGNRQLKATVKDGGLYESRRTFLTHPWLITDAEDNAWYVYLPDAQPRTVEILEPNFLALGPQEQAAR
jgi:hypothetical protein